MPRVPVIDRIDDLLRALRASAESAGECLPVDLRLLTERAAVSGFVRGGRCSCGGHSRLIRAKDGWIALTLARDVDVRSVPALLGCASRASPWHAVERRARMMTVADLVGTGRLLGMPIAAAGDAANAAHARETPTPTPRLHRVVPGTRRGQPPSRRPPLVIDLTGLWAGPLCGHLLLAAGARVIKIESRSRRDPIRTSSPGLFHRINAGKESVELNLATATGIAALQRLIARADIVISNARPRAFEQMGVVPEEQLAAFPGLTWVAITAYGWTGPDSNAIGFGDDVAAGAGLLTTARDGTPMFAGDAIADPIAGITAAIGALEAYRQGGGMLVDASLFASARWVAQGGAPGKMTRGVVFGARGNWWIRAGHRAVRVAGAQARPLCARAARLGAHTERVLREFS